jgi:O-methyltransferase
MKLTRLIYKGLKDLFGLAGVNIVLTTKASIRSNYEQIAPEATYAPWLSDIQFNKVYSQIKDNTLVDIYRCYELWQLVEQTNNLKGAFIEIGVWRGGSGVLIAQKVKQLEIEEKVYLCDTFEGVVKAGENDTDYKGGEHSDTSMQTVNKLIEKQNLKNTVILKGIFPENTAHKLKNINFRFCHVDVDVYDSVKDIFEWIWSKMIKGGVVVFDDYGFFGCEGVTKFVNQTKYGKDLLFIHNLNGHAIFIKLK